MCVPPQTFTGFGLGLPTEHYQDFLESDVPVDFLEVISERFMGEDKSDRVLRQARERHLVALHGVSMSVGCASGPNCDYLRRLRKLADAVDPLFVSDHLTWSRIGRLHSHGPLPLPYTQDALDLVCTHVDFAQNIVGRSMLFENSSSYNQYAYRDMEEWEFLSEMTRRTGCGILLDLNNIFLNSRNHGLDADAYLRGIPADRVYEIHLAGHTQSRDTSINTHGRPVCGDVWALYLQAISLIGPVATMIERDSPIPPLADLLRELDIARGMAMASLRRRSMEPA
jgi:uncharacterized protein (UPF0276 family)